MPQYKITENDEVQDATASADVQAPRVVVMVNGRENHVYLGARHSIKDGVLSIFAHGRRAARPAIEFGPGGWVSVSVFDYIKPEPGRMTVL